MDTKSNTPDTPFEQAATQGIQFNGSVTFNGPMMDIHDNQHVETHIHYAEGTRAEEVVFCPDEKKWKDLLEKLKEKPFFTQNNQWWAAFMVIRHHSDLPCRDNLKAFCQTAREQWGLTGINYDNLKKTPASHPALSRTMPAQWLRITHPSAHDQPFIDVARYLLDELREKEEKPGQK